MDFTEILDQLATTLLSLLSAHWLFLVYAGVLAFVGEVMKSRVWTPANIAHMRKWRDRWWNRGGAWKVLGAVVVVLLAVPLPFHPVIAAVPGSFFALPVGDGVAAGWGPRVAYLVGAAIVSLSLYDVLKSILRWRGINIALPGERRSNIRPSPPDVEDDDD